MSQPLISIILPTYNRCAMVRRALGTIIRQETGGEFDYEVVVIDNASTDATKLVIEEIAEQSSVPVRYFYEPNPGVAHARNCGLANAHGDWIAFFDDDELAKPDWLRQLFRTARETGAPVVGGAMHLDLPQETLDRLGKFVRRTSLREIDYYPTIQPYTDSYLPGTNNALVARHVFDKLGVFDSTKKCGEDDSEFFMRVRAARMAIYYTPDAIVQHHIPPNRITPEYLRWDARQGCSAFAGLDCKFKGRAKLAAICTARVGHALLVVVPRLAWGWMRGDPGEILGQRVRLWRTEGYVRGTLASLAPAWFPQQRFFADLEFRRGRAVEQQSVPVETAA